MKTKMRKKMKKKMKINETRIRVEKRNVKKNDPKGKGKYSISNV